ncbi:hypothetical protein QF001_005001 [Paraburkholderia youngii]|uniref:nucleotide-binding protein n=2 Tax=Paraburkholderia youngii TaxID=2782701 RepID=UPI003D254A9F
MAMENPAIYMVGGSKGGVGKSFVTLALVEYLRRTDVHTVLVETDTSNPDVMKAVHDEIECASCDLEWIFPISRIASRTNCVVSAPRSARRRRPCISGSARSSSAGGSCATRCSQRSSALTGRFMRTRQSRSADPLTRLFHEVSGDVPDEASLARMRRLSVALNLHDNDALWSMIAVLEYYARLYEAMPQRVRWAGEGSLEAARRETGGATDALMQQHREALERCKATIQLAENLIQEHEVRYRAALASLNEAAITGLIGRMSNQVALAAGNGLIGAAAVSAREQRERLGGTITSFERAVDASAARVEAMAIRMEKKFARSMCRLLLVGSAVLCLLLIAGGAVDWQMGRHVAGLDCRAVQLPQADGRP